MLIFWRLDILGVGGVRFGNNVLFHFYSIVRVLALPHIRHATLLDVLLHFYTYVMLRCWMFSYTSKKRNFSANKTAVSDSCL